MPTLNENSLTMLDVVIRMAIAVVCGGLIGMEREQKRRPAGLRTHMLICLGACMTTLTSQYLLLNLGLYTDPARLGAQVIAGIGFIGAGTIIVTKRRQVKPEGNEVLKFEGLEVDMAGRNVYVDGQKAELTPKEYELLFYLVRNKGIALTREKLLYDVWGFDFYGDDRTVDTHIKMLRGNLKEYRKFIVTLRGLGYKFEL